MELIRIKAFQPFACYRKPFSYGFWDTFPLPPFSTILGWAHWVLGESENEEKIPMNIGLVGQFDTITYDLQKLKKFDRSRKNKICANCLTEYPDDKSKCPSCKYSDFSGKKLRFPEKHLEDFNSTLNETVSYIANLTDVYLNIYIQLDKESRDKFSDKVLQINYPSLGRYEDLMRIDAVDIITPKKINIDDSGIPINYGVFLRPETAQKGGCHGSNFLIPFYHQLVNDMRFFEKEKVVYLDSGSLIPTLDDIELLIDENPDDTFDKPVVVELFGKYIENKNEVLC